MYFGTSKATELSTWRAATRGAARIAAITIQVILVIPWRVPGDVVAGAMPDGKRELSAALETHAVRKDLKKKTHSPPSRILSLLASLVEKYKH